METFNGRSEDFLCTVNPGFVVAILRKKMISVSCREQRVTGIFVFILTGLSVFMAPVLKVCTL